MGAAPDAVITGTYVDPRALRQSFHAFAQEWMTAQDWKDTTREGFTARDRAD